ncbi:MAG: SDR family NAD(P)-dependent oxidoreductase [Thermacetogeniaceae bacterium]
MTDHRTRRFCNKVALVVGGASGIGKHSACQFVREGGKVIFFDINKTKLQEIEAHIGDSCAVVQGDATNEEDLVEAIEVAVAKFGKIDIAVNSVMKSGMARITDLSAHCWREEIDVTLTGYFLAMKQEGKQLIKQGNGGVIINIASLRSKLPSEGGATYCVSKAGTAMLTRVAALEMARYGIRVNAVSPGLTRTPATQAIFDYPQMLDMYLDCIPMHRAGCVEDITAAILFLASDEASWITGVNLSVDGGWHMTRYPDVLSLIEEMAGKT